MYYYNGPIEQNRNAVPQPPIVQNPYNVSNPRPPVNIPGIVIIFAGVGVLAIVLAYLRLKEEKEKARR